MNYSIQFLLCFGGTPPVADFCVFFFPLSTSRSDFLQVTPFAIFFFNFGHHRSFFEADSHWLIAYLTMQGKHYSVREICRVKTYC